MSKQKIIQPSNFPFGQLSSLQSVGATMMRILTKCSFNHLRGLLIAILLISSLFPIRMTLAAEYQDDAVEPVSHIDPLSTVNSTTSPGLMFIENVGQFDTQARFVVRGGPGTLYLADDALWYTVVEPPDITTLEEMFDSGRNALNSKSLIPRYKRGVNLKISFPGANSQPRLEPFNRLEIRVSHFTGSDTSQWRADVPVWGGVRYIDLYPGVDLEITTQNGQLVQRLVVRDGQPTSRAPLNRLSSRLGNVRLRVDGADGLALQARGLQMTTAIGDFELPLFQLVTGDGRPLDLPVTPPTLNDREITAPFGPAATASLNNYSAPTRHAGLAMPLLALPPAQTPPDYSTFLGGGNDEAGYDIKVDSVGNAYLVGSTTSFDFPTTVGAVDQDCGTDGDGVCDLDPESSPPFHSDAFMAKINSNGDLVYATFLGGRDTDEALSLDVVDADVYVTGFTASFDFPTTPGALDVVCGNDGNGGCGSDSQNSIYTDAFIAKINSNGDLVYATFLGGGEFDYSQAIAVDDVENIYVAGVTSSVNMIPEGINGFDTTHNGYQDAFVIKLTNGGQSWAYGSYLGGDDYDGADDLAIDEMNRAYVAGHAYSSNFPTTPGAYNTTKSSTGRDPFVVRFNAVGDDLDFATYIGGDQGDRTELTSIAVDETYNVYATGNTGDADLIPAGVPGFDQECGLDTVPGCEWVGYFPNRDAFIIKLNATGDNLVYATYLGGDDHDWGKDIALDGAGNAYIVGYTQSDDFVPPESIGIDRTYQGDRDVFLAKLDASGTMLPYATYLGGSLADFGNAVAVDNTGNTYFTGVTRSTDFPTMPGAFDADLSGEADVFVTKLATGSSCAPSRELSPIGEAVATVVEPATGLCGSSFEELITIPPYPEKPGYDEDGTYAFEQFAKAIREAKYEVDFTAMEWQTEFRPDSPGDILLDGIEILFQSVAGNISEYPKGMTIRILMGEHIRHETKEDILTQIANRGIPIRLPESTGELWQIEVADYPVEGLVEDYFGHEPPIPVPYYTSPLKWSHVKTLIIDGETVIVAGYNVDDDYILTPAGASESPDDVWRDMGMKLSGEIAQNVLNMFDYLWEGSTVCLDFDETQGICTDVEIAGSPVHLPEILSPPLTGAGINVFSLFRDANDRTGELGIFEAMSASKNKLRLIEDRVLFVQGFRPRPLYVQGIHNALDNGSEIKYITDPWSDLEVWNITSFCDMRLEYALLHPLTPFTFEAKAADVYIHAKSIAIDDQMLIVGSSNMDFSSWHSPPVWYNGMDLAEYNLAVDDPGVAQQYDDFFENLWNSPSASDIHCSLLENGFESIQSIVDEAQPYDIVVLPEGIHQESVVIDKPLHILGMSSKRTVIEPSAGQPAFRITSSGVSIRDLTISGSTDYGIELDGSAGNSLEDIWIRRVLFEGNESGAIWAHGSPVNYVIENNTFISGTQGIKLDVSEQTGISSTLRNNIFYGQMVAPIQIDSTTDGGIEYSYNLFDNCNRATGEICPTNWYEGTLSSVSSVHDNLLNLDPEFDTTAGYYTLLPGSPAIDTGDPATQNEVDFDGYRPLRADIGAFETELMFDPDDPFREIGGLVVMEAEHYTWNFNRFGSAWKTHTGLSGETGPGHINVRPDVDLQLGPDAVAKPQLDYTINFTTTGIYHVWLRGHAPNAAGDSVFVSLDDQPMLTLSGFMPRIWSWSKDSVQGMPVTFEVTQPGEHVLHLWLREDGLPLDRIILTTNGNYQPIENGPAESQRTN